MHYHIDLDKPVNEIPPEMLRKILYGTGGEEVAVRIEGKNGRELSFNTAFEGVIPNLMRRYRDTGSDYIRNKIAEYMTDRPCPTCNGKRLRKEAMAVTVNDANIIEVTSWPVLNTLEWVEKLYSGRRAHPASACHCRTHSQRDSRAAGFPEQCWFGIL